MAEQAWKGTTYGSGRMHRWLVSVLRWLDVRLVYLFADVCIVPVCLLLSSGRRPIYRYLRRRHGFGMWRAVWLTYRNYCLFGQVVIDRFAMYAGRRFRVDIEGLEAFQALSAKPEGFVMVSSHIGNYELAGYTLRAEQKPLNALVYTGEKESVMEGRRAMFEGHNVRMIPVSSDMSHLFLIDRALQQGEIVSMPGDRLLGSRKSISVLLLGASAALPQGPFSVAAMRALEVLAVHVMKTSLCGYTVYVTPLDYDKSSPRPVQLRQLAEAYAAELQRMVSRYPEQWYNYFDFWSEGDGR